MKLFAFFPLAIRNFHRIAALFLILSLSLPALSCGLRDGMEDPTLLYASPYTASLSGEAFGQSLDLSIHRSLGALTVTVEQSGLAPIFSSPLDASGQCGRVTLTVSDPDRSVFLPDDTDGGIPALLSLLTLSRNQLTSLKRDQISGQTVYLAEFQAESGIATLTLTDQGVPLRLCHDASGTVLHFADFTPI